MVRSAETTDSHLLQRVLDDASGSTNAMIFGDDAGRLLSAHRVYLGFVDEHVVGCVMASVDATSALIHNLAVSQQHRNRGHATTLVQSVMAHLNDPVDRTYWAAADPTNPSAVKRFHLLGFVPYQDGIARDMILMVREAGRPLVMESTTRRDALRQASSIASTTRTTLAEHEGTASNDPI